MGSNLTEFIIGLQPSPMQLTDNSNLKELVLITERTSKVEIVKGETEGDDIVSAVLFDDGDIDVRVRDEVHSSKDDFVDNDDYLSQKHNSETLLLKNPFFKKIFMQQTCYSASDQPHLFWRRITYLRMESYEGDVAEVGVLRESSSTLQNGRYVLPEEVVDGPCMITGVGVHNTDIICMQIIASDGDDPNTIEEHLYAYGKSSVGLVNLKPEGGFDNIEKQRYAGMENSDPNLMEIVNQLYIFMANWYASRSCIHRVFPDLYSLIDKSITENDRNIIFATFRLMRHMRYRIQNQVKGHSFDRDPFLRIKLFQVVQCLADTLERCQRIIVNKPSINCYCIGYLSGSVSNKLIAALVFVTQVSLTYVLFLSVYNHESGAGYFELGRESIIITPIISVFSAMLVWKQMSNIFAINKAYPKMSKTLMGVFEVIVNGCLGLAILAIQIFLLTKQDNRLDYVLNSIATIFILELDDSVVFLDDDGITDLHRRALMEDFQERIKDIDDKFFEHNNWQRARNYLDVNLKKCTVEDLPKVAVMGSQDEDEGGDLENVEPLKITLASKSSTDGSGGWVEVASSLPIVKVNFRKDSKADLKFTWRDQGWGNRKGKMRVRLLNVLTDEDMASSPEYGIAPHENTLVVESFSLDHGLVRKSAEGCRFVVEILVGGGGGHELHLSDLEFTSSACLVKAAGKTDESDASSEEMYD